MANHSSTLAWKIPWTEKPGRLQSTGSQRAGHNWATSLSLSFHSLSQGFPGGTSGKETTCQCRRHKRCRFYPWVGKIPWRSAWQPISVFLSIESSWTREPGGLQFTESQRVGHSWSNWACTHTIFISKAVTCLLLRPWRDLPCAHGTSSGWGIMPNMNWKLSDPTSHKFSCPHQHSTIKFIDKSKPIPALKIQANYNGS